MLGRACVQSAARQTSCLKFPAGGKKEKRRKKKKRKKVLVGEGLKQYRTERWGAGDRGDGAQGEIRDERAPKVENMTKN